MPNRSRYAALVAALRDEFDATALESISIQMREHLYNVSSIGVLARAVYDAYGVELPDAGRSQPSCTSRHEWDAR